MVENDLNNFITTLKETSAYKDNTCYITQSNLELINFDKVKDEYKKRLTITGTPSSIDTLYKDRLTGEYYFIEFKSWEIVYKENYNIKYNIYDSLLILLDIIKETITFSRQQINYILVYDKNKEHALSNIQNHMSSKAKKEFIRFDLEKYKNIYFKNLHTYTFEEFENKFIAKMTNNPN